VPSPELKSTVGPFPVARGQLRNLARLMRTAPLWRQLSGLVDALAEETMDKSKIVDHTVYVIIDGVEPLDENAGHCWAELCARFSIVAHLPIEALELRPLTGFRHGAIQHARQFFVSHPNLRHGCPLEDLIDAGWSKPRTAVPGTNILSLS
jgi:hypothetical protein